MGNLRNSPVLEETNRFLYADTECSHSALGNVYPVSLDRTWNMTMTGKTRYKVVPLLSNTYTVALTLRYITELNWIFYQIARFTKPYGLCAVIM